MTKLKTTNKKTTGKAERVMTPADYLKMPYGRFVTPDSDGSFRAEIIEFPGCIAVGDTAANALANLELVAEGWLEAVIAKGQRVPDPIENAGFSGKLLLRLPKTLHKKASYFATNEGVSLNQFIVSSIAEHVGIRTQAMHFSPLTNLNVGWSCVVQIYGPQNGASASATNNRSITYGANNQMIGIPFITAQLEHQHARG